MRATVLVKVLSALVFQIAAEDAAYVVKMNGVSMGKNHAEQVAAKENDRAKQADVASSLVEQASADHEVAKLDQATAQANKEMKKAQAEQNEFEQIAKQVDAEKSKIEQAAAKAKEEKQVAEDKNTKAEHVVAQANEEMKQARVEQSQAQHNARDELREAASLKASGKMLRAQEAEADSEVSRMTYILIGLCILLAVFGSLVIVLKEQLSKAPNSLDQPLLAKPVGPKPHEGKRNTGQSIVDGHEQEIKDTACPAPTYVEWRFNDVRDHGYIAESLTECESKAPNIICAGGKDEVGADRIEWDERRASLEHGKMSRSKTIEWDRMRADDQVQGA